MKKIVLLIIMILGIVGCSVNCPDKPPRRAYMHNNGGMGMRYHFTLYYPDQGNSHSPNLKCPKNEYTITHLYTDDLGTVKRNDLIWTMKWVGNEYKEIPLDSTVRKNIQFTFTQSTITVQGVTGDLVHLNGTYKIETSPPSSWGVELVE
ncbi:MAG: hypothetical protein DSZ08_03390 [Sulfurovum sp.]|nr:MAG: hypothetical protein DSZ08_03390 [Sulfurovum sp.]